MYINYLGQVFFNRPLLMHTSPNQGNRLLRAIIDTAVTHGTSIPCARYLMSDLYTFHWAQFGAFPAAVTCYRIDFDSFCVLRRLTGKIQTLSKQTNHLF